MFAPSVIEKLQYYVYFLQDPESQEVFYVGKGRGNRVFDHLNMAIESSDKSAKLDRIREITNRGLEVKHLILRHGLTESMAFEIEAAMIDFIGMEFLSNIMGGHYSSDYGLKSPAEIMVMYEAEKLHTELPVLLVNVNKFYRREMTDSQLYNVARGPWILGPRREQIQYVIATYQGLTREIYQVRKWVTVRYKGKQRWAFKGRLARDSVRKELRYKSIKSYFKRGASNPIKYLNC